MHQTDLQAEPDGGWNRAKRPAIKKTGQTKPIIAPNQTVFAGLQITGATLRYLPPYSPDFNPIENAFSKLKALLRARAERTIDTLWTAVGLCLVAPERI